MVGLSFNGIANERRLLLPLVSAHNSEAKPSPQHRSGKKMISNSSESSFKAFKVFSTDG
jgi:hypothetical protein